MTERTDTWTTPGGRAVRMTFRDDTSDWNTISSILTHDEYGLPRTPGTFVDVGAHVGAWAVGVAVDNPGSTVLAIEPLPENADLIRRNAAQNDVAVAVLESAAERDGPSVARIRYGATEGEFARQHEFIGGAVWQEDPTARVIDVMAVPLSAVIREYGWVDVLKIDCEGCEWAFLDSPYLRWVRRIVGEYHPRGEGPFPARLRALLEPTHDVDVGEDDFGLFWATLR